METRVIKQAFPLLCIPQRLLLCARFEWYFLYGTESINSMLMWLIRGLQRRWLNLCGWLQICPHIPDEMQKGFSSIALPLVVGRLCTDVRRERPLWAKTVPSWITCCNDSFQKAHIPWSFHSRLLQQTKTRDSSLVFLEGRSMSISSNIYENKRKWI